jgi:hypothetical protein
VRWVILLALLALGAGAARSGAAGPTLPCGLPQTAPLWVDYADGQVPFWSTVFGHPGVVGAASGLIVPPQLRARGAKTVFFDLYLQNRVGTPTSPADPSQVASRADKLFDTAVTSSGCDHPLIAENELFGAQTPTPWTPTTEQYRANVLAYLTRLAQRGARPFVLLSNRPYTHDAVADDWWRAVAQVADLVPEVYFSGPSLAKQGPVAAGLRLRSTLRSRVEDLVEIGIPVSRLGFVLTFSSSPNAGGREGLKPLSRWLDVVQWESLAAKQVAAELGVASVWSWGWAAFNPAGADEDKPKVACTWLWSRDHSLCDAPALAGADLRPAAPVVAALPAGAICVLGTAQLRAADVAALTRLTGDRELAFSAAFQHAVLANARTVEQAEIESAERTVVADRFGGSRAAYRAALARARMSPSLARLALADELRRIAVGRTLRVAAPTAAEQRAWLETYASTPARLVRAAKPVPWLGGRSGLAIAGRAPARVLGAPASRSFVVDGVRVTPAGEPAPLGSFPPAQSAPAARRALVEEERTAAFGAWTRRRENQALGRLSCRADRLPQPASVDLTDWAPFLALP